MFGQGFGIVGKTAVDLAVQDIYFAAQRLQDGGHGYGAGRVDGIHHHSEAAILYGLHFHVGQGQNARHMVVQRGIIAAAGAEAIHFGVGDAAVLEQGEEGFTVGLGDEFAGGIEEFEGVPVCGVVAGREDDAAAGLFTGHGHFDGGRGGEAQVNDLDAQCQQGLCDQCADHGAGDASVAAQYDFGGGAGLEEPGAVGGGAFNDVLRSEVVAGLAADGAAYA